MASNRGLIVLSKEDKNTILDAFKAVDVKELEIQHEDPRMVKWFRFGSYNAMQIASEIIRQLPERKIKKDTKVS